MAARLTDREKMLRAQTESQFQSTVMQVADLARWKSYHAPENRPVLGRGGKTYIQNVRAGFPDLVLVRGERLVFAELKREKGVLTPGQPEWHEALAGVPGVEVYVWRPSDLQRIIRILA